MNTFTALPEHGDLFEQVNDAGGFMTARTTDGVTIIVVSQLAEEYYTQKQHKAFMTHEEAHVELKHLDSFNNASGLVWDTWFEIAADAAAGPDVIAALYASKDFPPVKEFSDGLWNSPEFQYRLMMAESMVCTY